MRTMMTDCDFKFSILFIYIISTNMYLNWYIPYLYMCTNSCIYLNICVHIYICTHVEMLIICWSPAIELEFTLCFYRRDLRGHLLALLFLRSVDSDQILDYLYFKYTFHIYFISVSYIFTYTCVHIYIYTYAHIPFICNIYSICVSMMIWQQHWSRRWNTGYLT